MNTNTQQNTLHFCTSIGDTSIPKLLTLYESLIRQSSLPFTFWVLCDGDLAYQVLGELNLPNFRLVSMGEFEEGDPPLLAVKPERNRFEYNCTLRPSWLLYLLGKHPEIDILTYMDTDLYFFADPQLLYPQMNDHSILLSEHRFYKNFHLEVWDTNEPGLYNAGWIAFKNDEYSLNALTWWRERCLEWCYNYYEDGKYGEQRYLNDWITRFPHVAALDMLGANVAPWNMHNYTFSVDDLDGKIMVNSERLIFYHFHALQWDGEFSFKVAQGVSPRRRQLTNDAYRLPQQLIDLVYKPYISDLEKAIATATKYLPNAIPYSILEEDSRSLLDFGNILLKLGRPAKAGRAFALAAFLQFDQANISAAKLFLQRALSALSQIEEAPSSNKHLFPRSKLYPAQVIELLRGLRQSRLYRLMRWLGKWNWLATKIEETLSLPETHAYPEAVEILRSLRQTRAYRIVRLLGMWSSLDAIIEQETT